MGKETKEETMGILPKPRLERKPPGHLLNQMTHATGYLAQDWVRGQGQSIC